MASIKSENELENELRSIFNIGHSQGITLPKKFLKAEKLEPGDQVRVSVAGGMVIVRPVAEASKK